MAWLEACTAWLEAPNARLETPEAWLEAPEAWLEAPEAWWWGGRTDVRTYVRTDRTKSPYSIGHRPLRGRCPKSIVVSMLVQLFLFLVILVHGGLA